MRNFDFIDYFDCTRLLGKITLFNKRIFNKIYDFIIPLMN